ncbi:hypothetical protein HPG69_006268, partial [Diceros bicornis minor]
MPSPPQPAPDLERHAAPGGPRIQARAAPGRGLEDQRRRAPRCGRARRGWGHHAHGRVTAAPPRSEPPLRLWAAGRRPAGGHGSHVAAHAAPAEMRHSDRARRHASWSEPKPACWPRTPSRPAGGPHLRAARSPILPLLHVRRNVSACAGRVNRVRSLEHVQVQLSLSYSRRGDLEIALTSPMGTRSTLVAVRPLDVSSQGYNNWVFMSTHFWDEDPRGLWTLGLENKGYYFNTGMLYRSTLLLYGTAEDMMARPRGPQVTSSACVQRDTAGLCQGECWEAAVCVCAGDGGRGRGLTPVCVSPHRVPQPRLPPGPPLPPLLPTAVLQPHAAASDRRAGAPGHARPSCLLQLPPV